MKADMPALLTPSPIVRFDPTAPVDLSPFRVGQFTVRRSRVPHTHYLRYSILVGEEIAGQQISYPDEDDCRRHANQFNNRSTESRRHAAMLDTDLHERIVGMLRTKEMDSRDLCRMFFKTSTVMAPVLSMLVVEQRIIRRGTDRRPIFTAHAAHAEPV